MELDEAAKKIHGFEGQSLTSCLAMLEQSLENGDRPAAVQLCQIKHIDTGLLLAASELKKHAGQINVVIHALGVLIALESILDDDEIIEYLSLGAGNSGKKFDLETNLRIAEFKFIQWKGGAEAIRQNNLFKDFYGLAEEETVKRKCLYVLGRDKPLRFLQGGRALRSVMSKNRSLADDFGKRYGSRFLTVSEYYQYQRASVEIIDITPVVPQLAML